MFNKNEENTTALIIGVRDELTGTFFQPNFFKGNEAKRQAIRLFETQVNDNPIWRNNPNDFGLYQLGEFNEETGEIKVTRIEKLTSGSSVLRKEK